LTNQESAFKKISQLVSDFKINESKFLSPNYSEADVRKDFIDKFFDALGWDVYHNEQKNPYEQEVKIEKGVSIGRVQKRADYAFFVAPNYRDVKFYLEAKKPSKNLANADDYFQSCRYGWNAGTQITFLFDFEEIHILDCRSKPDISTILNCLIKKYHYSNYVDVEKFAEIYWLLSREAVAQNSIEKFAETLPKPRGKAVQKGLFKGGYQSIDNAFLIELDEIRDTLAKSFKKANPHLESEELTEMTQRTIDRLVFIRFLEDKQIEPDHYVSEFGDSKNAWKDFRASCRKLDAKYNGIVFKKHFIDCDNFIEPDDKTFSLICEELAHVNSPYNFDIIPIHIIGSIYERFLGKVVIATDKRVRIEEKPEVRKAGGVYYTPQYIVNYIVENTVGKMIGGKTPNEISKLRFADISCGSGSFLITVFDRLLEYHRKWYQENSEQAKKDGCYFQDGKWILSLKQKQKILTNNIYGVDLDSQAVEVTQLSLYLKLLEDETTATAQDTWVMFKEQLLPNLNNNIICGNSLIGTDFLEANLFNREDELKLKPMNFKDAFPKVMKKGGFNAIVGNPPYVFGGNYGISDQEKEYLKSTFYSGKGKINLFSLFIEKAVNTITKNGLVAYIIPNTFLRVTSYSNDREFLLNNTAIKEIIDLDIGVFKGVTTSSIIFIAEKENKPLHNSVAVSFGLESNRILIAQSEFINDGFIINIKRNDAKTSLLNKIKSSSKPLGDFCKELIFGVVITHNSDDVITRTKGKNTKPFLEGKDIGRYLINYQGKYLVYEKSSLHRARTPEIFEVKEKLLVQRITGGKQPISVAYDNQQYYTKESINNIIIKDHLQYDTKYFLGLLNSSLINWFYLISFTNESKLTVNISKTYLSQLPVKEINFENEQDKFKYDLLIKLVNQMLESKKQLENYKTDSEKEYLMKKCVALDRQIDNLIYELYGLTEEEIKIIENN
jgi:hypothetical protein